jgi:hypothetical protein
MSRLTTLRLVVAATLVTAFTGVAIVASPKSAATMQKAATLFVDSLSPDQKAKASFPFDGEERLRWHFIPNEMFPRKGLMIKDMNETQRRLAHDLLRSGLSARGYLKATSIMELEDILKVVEAGGKFARNKEEYLFSIFGTPAAKGPLGMARRRPSHLASIHRRRRRGVRATWPARRCSSAPIRRKCRKGRRKANACSPRRKTPLERSCSRCPRPSETGDRQPRRSGRHPDDEQERHYAPARSGRGLLAQWDHSNRRCS